jgi:hypothetical protein
MFNIKRLDQLKLMLSHEKELSLVWLFYMDNFADHKEFTDMGERTTHSFIKKVVGMISKQLFNKTPNQLRLIILPKYKFIHGSFFVGNRIGGVIYFEDSLMGMIAVSEDPTSNLVKYSRFKGQPMN